jgi:PKHD-type hydroxylase
VSAIVLAGAIPAEVIAQIRARLAGGRFVPGRETAVGGAVAVKHNLQLARGEPAEERAVELLVGVLQAHPQFQAATWPDGMMRPMFSRYLAGMKYGDHIDGAIMGEPPDLLRCDVAVTVCLSDAAEYDGGELVIDSAGLPQAWKGAAGDIITYSADTLHRVAEVTRGVRDVAVLWVQSLVRDPARRRILFDMKSALDALDQAPGGPSAHAEAIRRSYFNLIRMWI